MTIRLCGLLLIALSVGNAAAAAKNQGHGKVSLGGTIVETPCGIASDSLDQTVDFGLISASDASQDGQSVLIGSRRHFTIKLVNCELASQVKPDFIYRAANVTFDGTADSRILLCWAFTARRRGGYRAVDRCRHRSRSAARRRITRLSPATTRCASARSCACIPTRRGRATSALWPNSPCLISSAGGRCTALRIQVVRMTCYWARTCHE